MIGPSVASSGDSQPQGCRSSTGSEIERGLAPLGAWDDQLRSVAAIYVLTAPELDFAGTLSLPANVHYVGPAFEHFSGEWRSPWPPENSDPLILVTFSTSYMNQNAFVQRVLDAVDGLMARVLFTAGPAIDGSATFPPVEYQGGAICATSCCSARDASLVITHAGWQTVNAALSCGVPLVCIPDGRDQPDNAVRVRAVGAGVRVSKKASIGKIRRVVEHTLRDPNLKRGAELMATALSRQDGTLTTVAALENLMTTNGIPRVTVLTITSTQPVPSCHHTPSAGDGPVFVALAAVDGPPVHSGTIQHSNVGTRPVREEIRL